MLSLSELTELIHERRSIFPLMFTGEKVDDELIMQLLQNANQAPTHKQTEPWRFHTITGAKLEALAQFFQVTYKTETRVEDFQGVKYRKLRKEIELSSHVIIISMQRDPEESLPEWEEIAAVACAVQNLFLSVTAAGLGGYWSSPGLMIDHIQKFINMEKGERCLGFFYLGVPQKNLDLKVEKGTLKDKIKWYT